MPLDHIELVRRYAMYGVKHWGDVPNSLKQKARQALSNNIAEKEAEASRTLNRKPDGKCLYIPMPQVNHSGIECCFFLPSRVANNDMAFDVFLFVDGDNSLGFRFEPSDPAYSTHSYSHVQMNQKMNMKQFEAGGIPKWIPDSYPAFAIRTTGPLEMFLSMATSVHGYKKGVTDIVRDILNDRPNDVTECLKTLSEMLE